MLRTGLIALLLLGLGSTAMAHDDRVRVFVDVGSYYGDVSYGLSYVGGGWDHGRWDRWNRYDRYGYDRHSYWRHGRYYPAPRGYYYYPKRHYGYRHGYSRGYYGDRHWHDRRHDGRDGRRRHRH